MRAFWTTTVAVSISSALVFGAPLPPPPKDRPTSEFPAILFTPVGNRGFDAKGAFGPFTLAGPRVNELKTLPNGLEHAAVDPTTKQIYGISWRGFGEVDLAKGVTTNLEPPAQLEKLSHVCGIAFDSKRDRVVIATLGGVGHLYSYTPKTGKWEIISDLGNVDLAALTYDPKEDRLYGLYEGFGGKGANLGVYNSKGAMIKSIPLTDPKIPAKLVDRPSMKMVQIAVVGGELAVVTEKQIIAVDIKTAKARVTWDRE